MDKRVLVSAGVGLAVVAAYLILSPMFSPKPAPPAPAAQQQPGAPSAPGDKPAPPPPPSGVAQDVAETVLTLESPTHRVTLTNKGAGVRELFLKASVAKEDVRLLATHAGVAPHFALKAEGAEKIQTLGWEVVESSPSRAVFRYRLASGIEIRKTFELPADGSLPTLSLGLSNATPSTPTTVKLELLAINGMEHDSEYRYEQYAAGFVQTENGVELHPVAGVLSGEESLAKAKTAEEWKEAVTALQSAGTHKNWFGSKNRFFALALRPDDVTRSRLASVWFRGIPAARLPAHQDRKGIDVSAVFDPLSLAADPMSWGFTIHAMPLKKDALSALPKGEALLNYGSGCATGCFPPFTWLFAPMAQIINMVAPLILGVLGFVASILGNHGVAIMVTTLLIRLVLFPLSKKSQVSMYRMQQLGPKIQVLRERYKDDQQKFGMEQMKLFRENKINPLSGCLPMVLQMPIFIAMYSVFEMSFDLRREPFVFWMKDLSQPDHMLGPWSPLVIPLIGLNIDAFNLLPIVMTITWFLQSWFAPRSPDPQMAAQQKMMLAMPIVFGLMCYNLASGLSLYFLVNSLLSMGEQKLIKKFFLKPATGDGPKG